MDHLVAAEQPPRVVLDTEESADQQLIAEPLQRTEAELLAAAQQDDEQALAELLMLHREKLAALASRYVGPDKAEDILQEVFINAWRGLPSFEDRGDGIIPWLYVITKNLSINAYRRERWLRERETLLNPIAERNDDGTTSFSFFDQLVSTDPSPEAFIDRVGDRLRAIIRQLTQNHQIILLEIYVEGLTIDEFAAKYDLPRGTALSRSARARERLAALMLADKSD